MLLSKSPRSSVLTLGSHSISFHSPQIYLHKISGPSWVLLWIAAEHILWTFSHLVHVCMGMAITNIGIVASLICGRPDVSHPPSEKYGLGIWYAVAVEHSLDQIFHAHSVKSVVWGCVMPRPHISLSECEKCGLGTRLYCAYVLQLTLKSTVNSRCVFAAICQGMHLTRYGFIIFFVASKLKPIQYTAYFGMYILQYHS